MATFSGGFRTSGAGTTARPIASLYTTAAVGFQLREVAIFNTTTTAAYFRLAFLTATGTQGTARDELNNSQAGIAPVCTLFDTHSADATVTAGALCMLPIGAAIGSGVIRVFGDDGVRVPKGATTTGVGIVPVGTGQICDIDLKWEEI